jgi:hypothetical protein
VEKKVKTEPRMNVACQRIAGQDLNDLKAAAARRVRVLAYGYSTIVNVSWSADLKNAHAYFFLFQVPCVWMVAERLLLSGYSTTTRVTNPSIDGRSTLKAWICNHIFLSAVARATFDIMWQFAKISPSANRGIAC